MKMKHERYADIVSWAHVTWVSSMITLGISQLVLFFFDVSWYLWVWSALTGCIGLQLVLNVIYGGCPLTKLENSLRASANSNHVPMKSFISDRCARWFGWEIPPEMVKLSVMAFFTAVLFIGPFIAVVVLHL